MRSNVDDQDDLRPRFFAVYQFVCSMHISKIQFRIIYRAKFQVTNTYGKFDYFNFDFRDWLAAITQFKNGRDPILKLGSRGSDVNDSTRAYVCLLHAR